MLDIRGAISFWGESVDVEKTRRNAKEKVNTKKGIHNHEEEDENQNFHYI